MVLLTQLIIGFSVVSAAILLLAYAFFLPDLNKTPAGIVACAALLVILIALQIAHWLHWETGFEPVDSRLYVSFLLLAPATFFYFSREVLLPERGWQWRDLVHLLPFSAGLFLPLAVATPVAFVVGAAYTLWYAQMVFSIRRRLGRFRFEAFFFVLFAVTALALLLAVILIPAVGTATFYLLYTHAIGWTLALIVGALISFPELLANITDAVALTYAKSTLGGVDVEAELARLDNLMKQDRLYQNENLSLAMTAEAMGLSPHQLSELINRHKGYGFSRYVRERRVSEARRLLLEDATASVLSIGLSTGFKSQSSFYSAFREIEGCSPGAYRKARLGKGNDS